jgi:hypothetical protein
MANAGHPMTFATRVLTDSLESQLLAHYHYNYVVLWEKRKTAQVGNREGSREQYASSYYLVRLAREARVYRDRQFD